MSALGGDIFFIFIINWYDFLRCIFARVYFGTFMQVMLINAAKDVASALSHLINSAKNASGKQANDEAMDVLKQSAKVSFCLS